MIIAIVLIALAVMAIAAIAGTGRFGEWQEPVTDRRKGHLPEGPIDEAFLDDLEIPRAMHGYAPEEVDDLLRAVAAGSHLEESPSFGIVRGGYDMQFVDELVGRMPGPKNPSAPDTRAGYAGRMADSENKE